jgi:hypothetical protein
MAERERKPRAKKTKAAGDANPAETRETDGSVDQTRNASTPNTAPVDGADQNGDGDGAFGQSRTTADHLHESMQSRPHIHGEVF